MTQDLEGKAILITGATDGIGKAAATEFAKRGATLTIIGRNKQKTEQVLAELKGASGNSNISLLLCDLSRMADVKRAAAEFGRRGNRERVSASREPGPILARRFRVQGNRFGSDSRPA